MSKVLPTREGMAPAIGAAILSLIGGERHQLVLPNDQELIDGPIIPTNPCALGSTSIMVSINQYWHTSVYAQYVDERCRELFGFGLVRDGNAVLLKRQPCTTDSFSTRGYAYTTDSKGRMMILGDYGNELNIAYIQLLEHPMEVSDGEPQYVYNNTARIYLEDLVAVAEWCGDKLIVNNEEVYIKPHQKVI